MMLSRRRLMKGVVGSLTLPLTGGCSVLGSGGQRSLVGCAIDGRSQFSAVISDVDGNRVSRFPLPSRGHGVAVSPNRRHVAVFARRPGSYFQVIDIASDSVVSLTLAEHDRHFYGHGAYSLDGTRLYTTEGVGNTSEGIIGVYDTTRHYEKIDEFSGFGIGPHEIIALEDGRLVVGVGGIKTVDRVPQNVETMSPALVYLNQQGAVLEQQQLANHQLSIRHLSVDTSELVSKNGGKNTVYCGQQYRGDPSDFPPLVAVHRPNERLSSLHAEPEDWARFNNYIASIAVTDKFVVATSPKGNCYGVWNKSTQELMKIESLADASGVVVKENKFVISSGAGVVVIDDGVTTPLRIQGVTAWDNHWSALS